MNDFRKLVDLASERLGGRAIAANDEFFAPKSNLLKPSSPVFIEGKFTSRGKWMDGWETRRRRGPGHDFAVVRLGAPGIVHRVVVETSFFKGNFPESCSLDACRAASDARDDTTHATFKWAEILPRSPLEADAHRVFEKELRPSGEVTHVRLNIFPDGGVARLRVLGQRAKHAR